MDFNLKLNKKKTKINERYNSKNNIFTIIKYPYRVYYMGGISIASKMNLYVNYYTVSILTSLPLLQIAILNIM